jgi:hypothetical protein
MTKAIGTHIWTFSRTGGVEQVVLKKGEDIANLDQLDQKLWAALSMPVASAGLARTLEWLDDDRDGKIRVPDILRAVNRLKAELAGLDVLFDRNDTLEARMLSDPELLGAAIETMKLSGDEKYLTLESAERAKKAFLCLPLNGDGVVTPASADDSDTSASIAAIIAAGYSVSDASGEAGVDAAVLEKFIADAEAWFSWSSETIKGGILDSASAREAAKLFSVIRDPLNDYFRRCDILAMAGSDSAMAELRALFSAALSHELAVGSMELERLPIALPRVERDLPMSAAMHPVLGPNLRAFFDLEPLGREVSLRLTQDEWEAIRSSFDAYTSWLASMPGNGAASLGKELLAKLASPAITEAIRQLIEADFALADRLDRFNRLETLLLLKRDFLCILENFVNFEEFYRKKSGIFQSGHLFVDGRELELCLDVRNPAAHASMAGLSSMYLLYCDLSRKDGSKKSIVAALTAGDADNMFVGRNGIFYDAEGKDWDAVVTKLVAQPISIREAFFSPYKWFVRTLEEYAMRRAANAEAANLDKVKSTAKATAETGKPGAATEALPVSLPKKVDVGTVAAIGVALGSVGAMVTSILGMFFGMGIWMPIGFIGVILLISGPSMILAWMKLRRRNLGPLLNAEGWAINGRLRINVPFGSALGHIALVPVGSARLIRDPFAEKKRAWILWLVLILLVAIGLAWATGWLGKLFGN